MAAKRAEFRRSAQQNARLRAVSFRLGTWYYTSAEGSSWGRKSTTHSPALTVDRGGSHRNGIEMAME